MRLHKTVPKIADHSLNFLDYHHEQDMTVLLHDIRVPLLNRGSGVRQGSSRFDGPAGSFICVVAELSPDGADSIRHWYLDEMGKLHEPG